MSSLLEVLRFHQGASRPICRKELAEKLGVSDRKMRNIIRDLRRAGHPVASTSDSAGYYMAVTEEEKRRVIAEYRSRGMDCLATAEALEKTLATGQMKFNL